MAGYFFDSSALGKHYHAEVGTAEVDRILSEPGARQIISRLTVVEMQSVFAGKVRTGVITAADFLLLRGRFLADIRAQQLRVARMAAGHFRDAERLIRTHGMNRSIRTLDALQLAVALSLQTQGAIDSFVCADRNLLAIAAAEGLAVIDPERP